VPAVFCPRCGKPNEEGASYCSSCGARLPEGGAETAEERERRSLRRRAGRLVGGTRRERMITAVTVLALVIAIVALVALTTGDDQDEYTEQANAICVESKQALDAVADRIANSKVQLAAAISLNGKATAEIVADWRRRLASLDPAPDRQEAAAKLDQSLGQVEAEARKVAGQARAGGDPSRLEGHLAAAGARAEQAIEELDLEACAEGGLGIRTFETR
jgi:hypothetical protein